MNLFRWFILRKLRQEPLRSTVTVAGIAVGIAVVVAIRLANGSSVLGFETALNAMSGRVSLEVTGAGVGVADAQLAQLDWLHDYGLVSPVIDADVRLRSTGPGARELELVRLLGVDILRDRPFREYPLLEGAEARVITTQEFLSLLTDPQAVVLTDEFARRHGVEVGSTIEMLVADRWRPLVIKGVLGREGPSELVDGNFALMDIAAAQWVLGRLGRVDRVDVQLRDEDTIGEVEAAIAGRLPAGLSVQRPGATGGPGGEDAGRIPLQPGRLVLHRPVGRSVPRLQHRVGVGHHTARGDRDAADGWRVSSARARAVSGRGRRSGDLGLRSGGPAGVGTGPGGGDHDVIDRQHVLGGRRRPGSPADAVRRPARFRCRGAAGALRGPRACPRSGEYLSSRSDPER